MTIMVTGGAGYIGSHTCIELIQQGHEVVIFDNFCNSHVEVIDRITQITKIAPSVVRGDIRDREALQTTLAKFGCDGVIHFAGLKSVADSVREPLDYYDNNVVGTVKLIEAMRNVGATKLVFSSSATVYGEPIRLPYDEDHPLAPINPYGQTKLIVENMLKDMINSGGLRAAILRYFNPVGSHPSGLIGENPNGVPNNLMPFVTQVAVGKRPHLNVFGNDYNTPDGTGVRDYVHVVDLAIGHLKALEYLQTNRSICVNLGTGRGTSVLELVRAFSNASNREIPVVFAPRRAGDLASYYANVEMAKKTLGWSASRGLDEMCRDAWSWQSKNPNGYIS